MRVNQQRRRGRELRIGSQQKENAEASPNCAKYEYKDELSPDDAEDVGYQFPGGWFVWFEWGLLGRKVRPCLPV
jgi:hypothetical protein